MRKAITEKEFLSLKDRLISSYGKIDDSFYLSLQNELLSYDLSNISSFLYEGIVFIGDSSSNISFSGTNANLDFSVLQFRNNTENNFGKIYAHDCNITNLSKLDYFYDKDSFSESVVSRYSHLFLSDDLDISFRKKFIERKLEIEDLESLDDNTLNSVFPYVLELNDAFYDLVEKVGLHDAICLLNANDDLLIDYFNIIKNNDVGTLVFIIDDSPIEQREDVFTLQRESIKSNRNDFDYHDVFNYSDAFRNKYSKIFSNSIGYKEIIEYSKDFQDFNLTLLSYDRGLRILSFNLGYDTLVELLKEYEELFDIIDEKSSATMFIKDLSSAIDTSVDIFGNYDANLLFRQAIMYTLPNLNIYTEEEYTNLFSKFGFSFLYVDKLKDLDKIDSNTVVISKKLNNVIGYYGLSNIKRFASESNAFDEEYNGLYGLFMEYLYDERNDLPYFYDVTYDEFLKMLRGRLIKRQDYLLSYGFLKGPVTKRKELADLFIPDDAPEELKNLFYTRSLSLDNLRNNPSWIPYLNQAYLPCCFMEHYLFPTSFSEKMLVKLSEKYGNNSVLETLSLYSPFFSNTRYSFSFFNDDLDNYSDFDSYMDVSVYNFIKTRKVFNWNKYLPNEFKNDHKEIFLDDDAPKELQNLFYGRELSLDFIRSHPEYIKYLINKDVNMCLSDFNKSDSVYNTILNCYGTSEKYFELISIYGSRLTDIMADDYLNDVIKTGDIFKIKDVLNESIRKMILNGKLIYGPDDKELLGLEYTNIFLDDNAPDSLKEVFYSGKLTFKSISSNPSWFPYLKDVDMRLALCNSLPYYTDEIEKFYKLFGDRANKLITNKAEAIDIMFLRENVDLMYDWYLKTGSTFIPSSVVMLNFDFNEADRFFEYRKEWASIAKNSRFSTTSTSLDSLLRMAYIFGTFHGDKKALNKINSVINGIPNTLDFDDLLVLNRSANSILRSNSSVIYDDATNPLGYYEYLNILKAMKDEGLVFDENVSIFKQIYSANLEEAKLKINVLKCPKSVEAIRTFMEVVQIEKVVSGVAAHYAFGGLEMKYDPYFRDFILDNLTDIVNNPKYYKRLPILQKRFDNYRHIYLSGNYSLDSVFDSLGTGSYTNVDVGNVKLAQTVTITGYSEEDFSKLQRVYNYGKLRCHSNIPRVVGQKNNFTYEILRLDDPLALTVGYHTGCCQDIREVGAWCMIHSMTRDNGRVMVVRDDENNLVAQSWVWRDKDLICFDDIEFPKSSHFTSLATKKAGSVSNFTDQILDVYKEVADELIRIDSDTFEKLYKDGKIDAEQYKLRVSKVTVGKGFNESYAAVLRNTVQDPKPRNLTLYDTLPEEFVYNHYTDASEQYILKDTDRDDDLSSLSDMFNYTDTYEEYTDNDFRANKDLAITLCDLERVTKGENQATENILADDYLCENLTAYYRADNIVKVMMNPNFAIIYDVNDDGLKIYDLFFNTNIDIQTSRNNDVQDAVSSQIGIAISQLHDKYGNISFARMNDNQETMLKKSIEKSKEGGVKHGTK